jgi:hypothetical protein
VLGDMFPSIARSDSVEMLRDGGSLCAVFVGADGSEYWLLVPIEQASSDSSSFETRRYAEPFVLDRPHSATPIQVSWEHASILLSQIVSMLPESAPRRWISPMTECLVRRGNITYRDVMALQQASLSQHP